jgi:SAM-dependent methyltransferase
MSGSTPIRSGDSEVWGADISDQALAAASSRDGFKVASAQATALPFADCAFDLVYSTEVIEHVLDPAAMLSEMRRVARRRVLVTTPVSQRDHRHVPDYEIRLQGHVNDFDETAVRRLFAPSRSEDLQVRRNLCAADRPPAQAPAPPRDFSYRLDQHVAKRFGSEHGKFVPLRNRDWIVITDGDGREPRARMAHRKVD